MAGLDCTSTVSACIARGERGGGFRAYRHHVSHGKDILLGDMSDGCHAGHYCMVGKKKEEEKEKALRILTGETQTAPMVAGGVRRVKIGRAHV